MSDGLYDVACSCLALCPDHSSALGYTTQGLAQVAAAADEGDAKGVLLDVVGVVRWGKDFGLVDVVYADGFEDLGNTKVRDCLCQMTRAELTWHSTKWPILALAITGIVTVAMISLIIFGSDMRDTPPSALISAGTRSRAMTATAPASSAILACNHCQHAPIARAEDALTCSALTTSIITPPFNMRANPVLTVKLCLSPFCDTAPLPLPFVELVGSSVAILLE